MAPAINDPRNQIQWLDAAKGVGILIVAAAHIFDGPAAGWAYLFHMPFFFFISGYLFRPRRSMAAFVSNRSGSLLIPYAIFLSVIFPLQVLSQYYQGSSPMSLKSLVVGPIFGGRALGGWTSVFWYVTCLYIVQVMANTLLTLSTKRAMCWALASLAISYVNEALAPDLWFPWAANVAFAALPFFVLGYIFRKEPDLPVFAMRYIVPVAILGIAMVMAYPGATYYMKTGRYGIPILSFVAAASISVLMMSSIQRWLNVGALGAALAQVGKCSLIIMFLHQPFQIAIDEYTVFHAAWIRFVLAVALSMLCYRLFALSEFGRRWFLGQRPAYRASTAPLSAGGRS